jgi:hypothetical protein
MRVTIFRVFRDCPGLGHNPVAINEDRNPTLSGLCYGILVGETPRYRLEVRPLCLSASLVRQQ